MNTQPVTFSSGERKLAGVLFLPEQADAARLPAVIVAGSWLTVKEQMPANYAPLLAEAGYAALTFDFSGFGQSEGSPREVESARIKAEDLAAAARFLQSHPRVDGDRIGVLAICASAGYAALSAINGAGFRSIAMVAPWLHDKSVLERIYGGASGVADRLDRARQARRRFDETGTVEYVKAASNSDPTAAMYWEGDALDYYLNPRRGAVPEWGGRFASMAWTEWLEFDSVSLAKQLATPTRVITGDMTATPDGAKEFAAALRAPHDVVLLDGTQFDFYDNPATVAKAANAAVVHFRSTL